MISVFLVDDERLVREGLKRLLKEVSSVRVVGEAATGEAAIAGIREKAPDVVLLDLHMPDLSGLQVSHKLLQQNSHLKIIILTATTSEIFSHRLLDLGVHGYFTKQASRDELVNAIEAVYRGERVIENRIANGLAIANTTGKTSTVFENLSDREMEVMLMMLQGIPTETIAAKLYLSPKTVATYRIHIFAKLKVQNDVELLLLAVKHGLIDVN